MIYLCLEVPMSCWIFAAFGYRIAGTVGLQIPSQILPDLQIRKSREVIIFFLFLTFLCLQKMC